MNDLEAAIETVLAHVKHLEDALAISRYDADRLAGERDQARKITVATNDQLRRMLTALDAIARSDNDDPDQLRAMARIALYGPELS